jgi:hypothetical protein
LVDGRLHAPVETGEIFAKMRPEGKYWVKSAEESLSGVVK